jgi:hypothetical protein
MKKAFIFVTLFVFMAVAMQRASAQSKVRVRFAAGTYGTTLKGTVRGFAYRDYIVGVSAGQSMKVSIDASNPATVFSIFAPNGNNLEEAAETDGYSGQLSETGDFVIRVAMMRSAARRKGSVSKYSLKISVR